MTVVVKDLFGGGDDTDIVGRTPDTVNTSGTSVWAYAYKASAGYKLAIQSGKLVPPAGVLDTLLAVVTGHGLTSADYSVRSRFSVTLPGGGLALAGPGVRVDAATGTGYWAVATIFDDFITYFIYWVGAGANFVSLAQTDGSDPTPAGEITLDLSITGQNMELFKDGVSILTTTDPDYTAIGNPGYGEWNSDPGSEPEAFCSLFEVDDTPTTGTPVPDPCTVLDSQDEFLVNPLPDIQGRRTDQYPAQGVWDRDTGEGSATDLIGCDAGIARKTGSGRATYRDTGIGIGNDYCAEVVARFPATGISITPGYGEWRYRVFGNVAGVFNGSIATGLVSTLVGTTTVGGITLTGLTVLPNGQPKDFNFEVTVAGPPAGGDDSRGVEFYATAYIATPGAHTFPLAMTFQTTTDPGVAVGPGPTYEFGTVGGPYSVNGTYQDATHKSFTPGPQNGADGGFAHPYPPFYYPFGQPGTQTLTPAPSISGAGTANISITLQGSTQSGAYDISLSELMVDGTDPITAGGSSAVTDPGGELADVAVLVRYDATTGNGYRIRLIFDHTGGGIVGTLKLESLTARVPTRCRSWTPTLAHDTDYTPLLRVFGTVLVAVLGGSVQGVFDVATDLADETSATVPTYATGDPALSALDASGTGAYLAIDRYTVYSPDVITPPCIGPPDNPYPGNPPPTSPMPPVYLYVREHGAWRPVLAPVPAVQVGDVHGKAQLQDRLATNLAIRHFGRWVGPSPELGDQLPPPETPLPPFSDPCALTPPVQPIDVPVLPLTDRFLGMGNAPVSVCGPLFNGTKIATGGWTGGDLSAAAAKNVALVGGQGGYNQYKVNNQWNKAQFIAVTIAKLTPILATLVSYTTSGTFFGYPIIDDFEVKALWPPNGVPEGDLYDALNAIRAACPGIRLGVRGRPSQFSFDLGFDFYHAQFQSWSGKTATAFATLEYGRAVNWNAYCLLDLNYLHGGNGSSGVRFINNTFLSGRYMCSAAEVVSYLSAMFLAAEAIDGAAKLPGSVGYQYWPGDAQNPPFLSLPGMVNAFATVRNVLANLTPVP